MPDMVAALYVEKGGVYWDLPGVDPWDEERDARLYAGPWPVVAHPPCARWSVIASLVEHVHGYKRGDDGGCFAAALDAVKSFGGVLEHPANSQAWPVFGLPRPTVTRGWTLDLLGGASCFVDQQHFGLPMSKPTWLYAHGCELPDLWSGEPLAPVAPAGGRRDQWRSATRVGHRVTHLGKRAMSPPAFRDALLNMARSVPAHPSTLTGGGSLVGNGRIVSPEDDRDERLGIGELELARLSESDGGVTEGLDFSAVETHAVGEVGHGVDYPLPAPVVKNHSDHRDAGPLLCRPQEEVTANG